MTTNSSRDTEKQWLDPKNENTALTASTVSGVPHYFWEPDSILQSILTLTADTVLDSPQNMTIMRRYHLMVKQDGTGGRQLSFGAVFRWHQDIEPTICKDAGAMNVYEFFCDGTYFYGRLLFTSNSTDQGV